ncbi:GlsB/YeaQ/YmgE family stress response membrane protein [Cumulibacter manganitolerans]|uniref:GlsB/YeaQ/YmgE family stress response membrane protein n=1 Tax=Cumulibacter manganitolerans TaxID=1884992 RepID=UPI0012955DAC|nr:GlsB/YeaQ/YmgE family stress response membrane protein [Cumulibacter manganitolerans]
MLGTIIGIIIVGLIAGFIARALVPGDDSMSIGATLLLGIVGSFIGGFLGYLIFHKDADEGFLQPSSWIGSIIGAIIALLIWRAVKGRRAVR